MTHVMIVKQKIYKMFKKKAFLNIFLLVSIVYAHSHCKFNAAIFYVSSGANV